MLQTCEQKLVKISRGKAYIGKELELGEEVRLAVVGYVVKVEDSTNEDGTFSRCFVVRAQKVQIFE